MGFIMELLHKQLVRRILILFFIGIVLFFLRDMLNLFLLTFIFTYLIYSLLSFSANLLKNIIKIHQRVMILFFYMLVLALISYMLYKYIPAVINQSKTIMDLAKDFYDKPDPSEFEKYIISMIKDFNVADYIDQNMGLLFKSISNIGKWGLNIFLAIILSLFFLLEKNRVMRFTARFKNSKVSFLYDEIQYFGKKFLFSFGKVIQAQVLIALINSALSVIALWIMGFPQVLGLGLMIFVLGLIPVAGVIISLFPLSMIALTLGGMKMVIYVLIMIAILHALESYLLNPKLMSHKTDLPIFYTFLILLVSEHVIGIWGLIIGIPIFIFIMDLMEVNPEVKLPEK